MADLYKWTLQGTASGSSTINVPSNYNELLAIPELEGYHGSIVIPKAELSSTNKNFNVGWAASSTGNGMFSLTCNSSTININLAIRDSQTKTASATLKLYYR